MRSVRKSFIACVSLILLALCTIETGADHVSLRGWHVASLDAPPEEADAEQLLQEWHNLEVQTKKMLNEHIKNLISGMMETPANYSRPKVSNSCTRDLTRTLLALPKLEKWAFEMLDASGKIPSGLLKGKSTMLGDYYECLNLDTRKKFKGKFCTMTIMPSIPSIGPYHLTKGRNIPALVNLSLSNSLARLFTDGDGPLTFFTSLCVPSTCSGDDVRNLVLGFLQTTGAGKDVKDMSCTTKEDEVEPFTTIDIVCIVLLSTVIGLFIIGTALDFYFQVVKVKNTDEAHGTPIQLCLCFSAYTNVQLLMRDDPPHHIGIFNGMRVFSILWIVLSHEYAYLPAQVTDKQYFLRDMFKRFHYQFLANGYFAVYTFFFMSAVVLAYSKKHGTKLNIPMELFRRWWRIAPPLVFTIALTVLARFIGSGPFWKESVGYLSYACRTSWWRNLIFINNYSEYGSQCMWWMWYVSTDTQLFCVSVLLVIPFILKKQRTALAAMGVFYMVGVISLVVNHVIHDLPPMLVASAILHSADMTHYLRYLYVGGHVHIVTYATGLAVGYLISRKPKLKFSVRVTIIGYLLSFVMALTVIYGVYAWNKMDALPPNFTESVLYATFGKMVYAASLSWITITCVTGNAGIVKTLLSLKIFALPARLTYMVYLLHPLVQSIYFGSMRVLIQADHRTIVTMYLAHVLLTYMLAFVGTLIFEMPFMVMEKILLRSFTAQKKEQKPAAVVDNKFQNTLSTVENGNVEKNQNITNNGVQ